MILVKPPQPGKVRLVSLLSECSSYARQSSVYTSKNKATMKNTALRKQDRNSSKLWLSFDDVHDRDDDDDDDDNELCYSLNVL